MNHATHTFRLLFFLFIIISSCNGQENTGQQKPPADQIFKADFAAQIGEFVVETFEDTKGNLWFGTMAKGVAKYDGTSLTYLSTKDGLSGNTVASIAEDKAGNLWFGTHSGLSKYDGNTFTNFTKNEGLCDNRVSSLLIDQHSTIWVGTWSGVCTFNGNTFSNFPLPKPDVEIHDYQTTMDWVTEILEDRQGNIWFCRDGYGACRYDGQMFTQFTKKDGLPSNNVQAIAEDKQGNIWFGCRIVEKDHPDPDKRTGAGGLSRYDGQTLVQFPDIKGFSKNDIYAIYADKSGNIWIGANGVGAYRYDGQDFTLFSETDRKDLMPYGYGIQSILEDRNGKIWFGMSGGLFRLEGSSIINVSQSGPWK